LPVLILSAVRTPLGTLGGSLRSASAVALGASVIQAAVARSGVAAENIGEVAMGCAFQAGMGPNPARQAALQAGLPEGVSAWTLNQLCASGLMAVIQVARNLEADQDSIAVAGGFESPSNVPYLLPSARWGKRMGATELRDLLLQDGPEWFSQIEAPLRESPRTISSGAAASHILKMEVRGRKDTILVDQDELSVSGGRATHSGKQAPAADGAAALVLASESMHPKVSPLACLLGCSVSGAGVEVQQRLAERAGLSMNQIHRCEVDDPLLAVGGTPLLVDLLHSPRHRFSFISVPTGDGQNLSLLLELY